MSSGSAALSSSSITPIGTIYDVSSQASVKPGKSPFSSKDESSYRPPSSVSASFSHESHVNITSPSLSTLSTLGPSSSSSVTGELHSATSAIHRNEREEKVKLKRKHLGGLNLDFHYRNLLTVSGHGRRSLGTGSGAPGGCDLM